MHIDLSPDQKRLRTELRTYLAELITEDVIAEVTVREGGGPEYTRVMKRLGADGWLGIGWPTQYGGQGRPATEQFVFFDEIQRAGFPIPFLTLCTVGPTLIEYGSEAQRAALLPRILAGELHFSIGYTEPAAGTDLASLETRAVRDGDDYIVNGQKVFTSLADHADYIWLAARTDPQAPKHAGISILMVDTRSRGYSQTPIRTLGDNSTSATYYENVRVPVTMRVGAENAGWKLITNQLNHERVALMAPGPAARLIEETVAWAREAGTLELPWVQANLARAKAKIEVLRLMCWRQACNVDRGRLDPAESSTVKVFGSESSIEIYQLLMEVVGPRAYVREGSPGAALRGRLERYYRTSLVLSFGGGTNEIQRDIIAMAGLRMPRAPR
jgi:alkylation response protein AidB-like acyl-CoA dehydrogenase